MLDRHLAADRGCQPFAREWKRVPYRFMTDYFDGLATGHGGCSMVTSVTTPIPAVLPLHEESRAADDGCASRGRDSWQRNNALPASRTGISSDAE
jgi:hypothetical protein